MGRDRLENKFLILGVVAVSLLSGCTDENASAPAASSGGGGGTFYVGKWVNDYDETLEVMFGGYRGDEITSATKFRMAANDKSGFMFISTIECEGATHVTFIVQTLDRIALDSDQVRPCAEVHAEVHVTARGTLVVEGFQG